MDRLIYTAMTGASQAFMRQAGVANNLANASTTGFRAMEHRFRAVPVQGPGAPTRAFVVDASVANVFDQGPLMATGRPLDVAVHGVEASVALDHGAGQGDVAAGHAVDGVGHLGFGQTAHTGDLGGQLVQLVAVSLDGVLVHPNRPVM